MSRQARVVFGKLASNMRALTYPMDLSPPKPEGLSPRLCDGALWRRRIVLRFEQQCELAKLGPAPPLSLQLVGPHTIADLTPTLPAQCVFLEGTLTLVPHAPSRTAPTVAATLAFGGPARPVCVGSRVSLKDRDGVFVVMLLDTAAGTLALLHDVPGNTHRKGLVRIPLSNVDAHLTFDIDVLSRHGIARSFTTMPVPPLGCAKQAWLWDDGKAPPRAFVPDWQRDCSPRSTASPPCSRHTTTSTRSALRRTSTATHGRRSSATCCPYGWPSQPHTGRSAERNSRVRHATSTRTSQRPSPRSSRTS